MIGREGNVEHLPFHPADMIANLADVHKAGELLGWEPRISLQEGIHRMVDWYMRERDWASQIEI